jgi:hypothetical protein
MKRMTDEEFDAQIQARRAGGGGWRTMYAAARKEADRSRGREVRLEAE